MLCVFPNKRSLLQFLYLHEWQRLLWLFFSPLEQAIFCLYQESKQSCLLFLFFRPILEYRFLCKSLLIPLSDNSNHEMFCYLNSDLKQVCHSYILLFCCAPNSDLSCHPAGYNLSKTCGKFRCFHEDAPDQDDTLSGASFCIPITAFLASETHIAYAATAIASALQAVHSCLELPHGFLQRGAGAGGVQAHEARKAVSEGISLIQAQLGLVDEEVPQFLVGHA